MELVADEPGAATTSMRPSLGPVTGAAGWSGVAPGTVVAVAVGTMTTLDALWPRWWSSWWPRPRPLSRWSWSGWWWSSWSRWCRISWPGRPGRRRWRPAPPSCRPLRIGSPPAGSAGLSSGRPGPPGPLVGIHGGRVHGRLEHEEPQQGGGGGNEQGGEDPLGQDGLLGEGPVEDEGLLVCRGDLDLVRLLLLRPLPEPLPRLDPDPDEAGLARCGRQRGSAGS